MTTDDRAASSRSSPLGAWDRLRRGNDRFVAGLPEHPGQDAAKRAELSDGQRPFAMVFGCSDSRVAAEIVFDQGLGDLFVIRTAGHVVDSSVLGSIEFGVSVLHIPLILVLGHDRCGAVAATVRALDTGLVPGGFLRDVVERVTPSVLAARRRDGAAAPSIENIEAEHVAQTANLIIERSTVVKDAVSVTRCVVMGATYQLATAGCMPGGPTASDVRDDSTPAEAFTRECLRDLSSTTPERRHIA